MSPPVTPNGVCAVIVSYNPDSFVLTRLIEALLPQVAGIVVVDNGSEIDVAALLADWSVTVLPQGLNLGVAAGFNQGIAWAADNGFEQVLLLDQDSVPAPDMVGKLLEMLKWLTDKGEPVAAVGPVAYDPRTGHEAGFARVGLFRFRYVSAGTGEQAVKADFLISSGSLIPMSTIRQIGGMDEGLFIDLVDTEWFLRAAASGLYAYGVPSALLQHGIGDHATQLKVVGCKVGSLHHHDPLRHYYIFRNSILLSRRPYIQRRWVLNNTIQLVGMFVYFCLFTPPRRQHLWMMVRGLLDGLSSRFGQL